MLGVTGVAMFTTGLILTLARKSESVPFGDGGGETLESFDPSKGSGRVVKTDKLTSARLQWPKTYTAPDGVNTITENEDGTGSMTLAWVPKSKPSEVAATDPMRRLTMFAEMPTPNVLYDNRGFRAHVITQAEAEEVMMIIRDSLNAHHFALEFYETALKTMTKPDEQAKVRDNIDRVMMNSRRLIEFEAKWRKRVEEGKP